MIIKFMILALGVGLVVGSFFLLSNMKLKIGGIIAGALVVLYSIGIYYIPPKTSGHTTMKLGTALGTGELIATSGKRGQQSDLLLPGLGHNLLYPLFMDIDIIPDLIIGAGKFAVIKAKDGAINPKIIAPNWNDDVDPRKMIEDFEYFIANNGTRGVQQYILTTGNYRINRFQWDVREHSMINIESNEVLVIESKFGKSPAFVETSDSEILSVPLVKDKTFRGIVNKAFPSGYYAVHPLTEKGHKVVISLQTFIYGGGYTSNQMDLAIDPENDKLITLKSTKDYLPQKHGSAFEAKTKDNHTVKIDVRVLGQIEPTQAPRFIGTIKHIEDLDDNIIEPYTRNILTNMVLKYSALDLKDQKEALGKKLSEALRARTKNTGFRTKTVEITNIDIPPIVLIPGKIKSASESLKSALIKKSESVEQAIKVQNMQKQADNQTELAQATVANQAATQNAEKIAKLADANLYKEQKEAEGKRYAIEQEASAQQERMEKHALGVSKISKAIGKENAANILLQETINQAADKYAVPEILINGGSGGDVVGAHIISKSIKQALRANSANTPVPLP